MTLIINNEQHPCYPGHSSCRAERFSERERLILPGHRPRRRGDLLLLLLAGGQHVHNGQETNQRSRDRGGYPESIHAGAVFCPIESCGANLVRNPFAVLGDRGVPRPTGERAE